MLDNFFIMIAMGIGAVGGGGPVDQAPPVSGGGVVVAEPPKAGEGAAVAVQPPAVTGTAVQPAAKAESGGDDDGGGFFGGTDETANPAPQVAAPAPQATAPAPQVAGGYVAEPQVPTGKFTTAIEIKPIMGATKGNWVAVREYDGNDLIYFSHLLAWRCGLVAVNYSINGAPMKEWPLPPCQIDTNSPNAIQSDARIYEVHPLKSIGAVTVEIIYDDLTRDSASFERKQILMP